jgi:predicted nucleic acid-binding protein
VVIRLALDVNVWVNHYLSLFRGRTGSAAQQLVASSINGSCRLGEIQPIISHLMLDTLQGVLVREGMPEDLAEVARSNVEAAATDGVIAVPPIAVLGGRVSPMMDEEDQAVLEMAIAGGADLLVTSNMRDFIPGPRSDIPADEIRRGRDGSPDVLIIRHARLSHGLVIASVPAARAWLINGVTPPGGLLERFLP